MVNITLQLDTAWNMLVSALTGEDCFIKNNYSKLYILVDLYYSSICNKKN
jgi:hypothetical protein